MTTPGDIFAKQRLTIGQMRSVAERRFDDAKTLCDTELNARANGAQYMAGIAIEILLKRELVKRYASVAINRNDELTRDERERWNLIWRSHSLMEMLDRLPAISSAVELKGRRAGRPYYEWLADICSRWTIFARYTSITSNISEARQMLERVRELKEVFR